jgi:hypothetical protein
MRKPGKYRFTKFTSVHHEATDSLSSFSLTHAVTVQASRKTIPRPQVPIQHFSAHPELQAKIAKVEPLD